MEIVNGNLFDAKCDVIVHQTNCIGLMGSGIAKEVRSRFPEVYKSYKELCDRHKQHPSELLGQIQTFDVGPYYLVNLFGQCGINKDWYLGGKVTDYEALNRGFKALREFMESKGLTSLGVPYLFGCARGGGKWDEVTNIIISNMGEIKITAYKL